MVAAEDMVNGEWTVAGRRVATLPVDCGLNPTFKKAL